MADPVVSRRLPLIALGLAVTAVVITLVVVIVVMTRDGASAPTNASTLVDQRAKATDVMKLRDSVELVVEAGRAKGVRVKDAALAKALGLVDGDVMTALTGRMLVETSDVREALFASRRATTVYAEITRGGAPTLLRWQLDGDMSKPSNDGVGALGTGSMGGSAPSGSPVPDDPLLDTIVKVDETHYQVPRATVDAWLANPMSVAKGARVVPAIKNGQPEGMKLYAIRPSSMYARFGLLNGDTLHAINGHFLRQAQDALEAYTALRDATKLDLDIARRGTPMVLTIEITK
ncbi:MAG: hypothetical protein SFX73_00265 [Kofleriaceae bacterium]|nr:hypothetical protein [Kofleriaceae bacterium]